MGAKFTVYGRRKLKHARNEAVSPRNEYAPLHKEGLLALEDATLWLMDEVLKHGVSEMDVVIVRLDNGVDVNGERHVVRRVGEGRAWWE